MREKLNSNPLAQVAVIGVLLVLGGVFFMSTMGKGGDSGSEPTTTTTSTATLTTPAGSASVSATVTAPTAGAAPSVPAVSPSQAAATAPPLPRAVTAAWAANRTVVLLFVRNGGIDDGMVSATVKRLSLLPGVAAFVVPAGRISRYAAIAQGVEVNRVPALVVLRPKNVGKGIPTASVSYGFQSPAAVVQAVVDAGYQGRTVPYHP
jgi:hypothetical protein